MAHTFFYSLAVFCVDYILNSYLLNFFVSYPVSLPAKVYFFVQEILLGKKSWCKKAI